jgi:hypothetical protein
MESLTILFLAGCLVFVGVLGSFAQEAPKESEIPMKLAKVAEKAFKAKATFFIWTDKPAMSAKEFSFHFAINPAMKAGAKLDEVGTRVRLVRTVPNGMRVPWTGIEPEIGYRFAEKQFAGKLAVKVELVQTPALDADKPVILSNEITVQLTFE